MLLSLPLLTFVQHSTIGQRMLEDTHFHSAHVLPESLCIVFSPSTCNNNKKYKKEIINQKWRRAFCTSDPNRPLLSDYFRIKPPWNCPLSVRVQAIHHHQMWLFLLVTGSNGACWVLSTPSLSWAPSVMEKPSKGTQVITVSLRRLRCILCKKASKCLRSHILHQVSHFTSGLTSHSPFFRVYLEVLVPKVVWVLRWDANPVHSHSQTQSHLRILYSDKKELSNINLFYISGWARTSRFCRNAWCSWSSGTNPCLFTDHFLFIFLFYWPMVYFQRVSQGRQVKLVWSEFLGQR